MTRSKRMKKNTRLVPYNTGKLARSYDTRHKLGDLTVVTQVTYVPKIDVPEIDGESFAKAVKHTSDAIDSFRYSLFATAFAFGIPNIPPNVDQRIYQLSIQLPTSYDDTASGIFRLANGLGISVSECLDRIDNKISNLTELCNCYYAIKHWDAPDRAPLQALIALPDPKL